MKWNGKTADDRHYERNNRRNASYQIKWNKLSNWHKVFAWVPTQMTNGKWVWLENYQSIATTRLFPNSDYSLLFKRVAM